MNILINLASFSIFILLQGLLINGWHQSQKEGMIFSFIPHFLEKTVKAEWINKMVFKCIRCESSIFGALTFIPVFIYFFGFRWIMIPILISDIFILVTVNWLIYKKI